MVIARKVDAGFILLGFFIVLLIAYFQMGCQAANVSKVFTLSFVWQFSWFIRHLYCYKPIKLFLYVMACVFFSTMHVLLLSPQGASFEYYNKLIMFVCFLLFVYLCSTIRIRKKLVVGILLINVVLSLLYVYYYFYGTQVDEWVFVTLNFPNPNFAGIFLSYSLIYTVLFSLSCKELNLSRWFLLLLIPLSIMLAVLLVLTFCRAALLTGICYLVLILIDKLCGGIIRLKKWMVFAWSILPMLFVIFYVALQGNIASESILVDEESGKSTDTRMVVWGPSVKTVKENLLFGDYNGISGGTGISQLHNTHLDVIASYGFLPFVMFVLILYKAVSAIKTRSNLNKYSQWAFMVCFVSGVFEAVLVAGGLCVYILACGFLLLANSDIST